MGQRFLETARRHECLQHAGLWRYNHRERQSGFFEYTWQDEDAGAQKVQYAEAGYTFADVACPRTRYSQAWESLFIG